MKFFRLFFGFAIYILSSTLSFAGDVYTVSGVRVDARGETAAVAKQEAISRGIGLAYGRILDRVSVEDVPLAVRSLDDKRMNSLLSSLSIEDERTAHGRYIGSFSVRFRPELVRQLLGGSGVRVYDIQSESVLVIPLFYDLGISDRDLSSSSLSGVEIDLSADLSSYGILWLESWHSLDLGNALTPIILADKRDIILSSRDGGILSFERLEDLQSRYGVNYIILASATGFSLGSDDADAISAPVDSDSNIKQGADSEDALSEDAFSEDSPTGKISLNLSLIGFSPSGDIDYNFEISAPSLERGFSVASSRLLSVLESHWKSINVSSSDSVFSEDSVVSPEGYIQLVVPLRGLDSWPRLRSRLSGIYGIHNIEVQSLSGNGATIIVHFDGLFEDFRSSLLSQGFSLSHSNDIWVLNF